MLWLLLCLTLGLVIIVYRLHRPFPGILRHGQPLRCPPNTLPILGNAIQFLKPRHELFDWFVQCRQQYGKETLEISVPSLPPGVIINSAENLEFVFKNESAITKGDFFRKRSWDLFGHGIINATGDLWRTQRKAGLKFFSGTNLDILIEEVLPEMWEQTRKDLLNASETGKSIDLQQVFVNLTTQVVGHMAYDMEISSTSPFTRAFDHASDCVGLRFQNPLYFLTERFTSPTLTSSIAEVKRFGHSIVSTARRRRANDAFASLINDEEPRVFGSLIDSLLASIPDGTVVADAALNFLSAARDTTAQSLTWLAYALARHPEVVSQLRVVIDQLVLDQSSTTALTVAALQPTQTPYLTAVFYEALRLYPPVPFELKQCETAVSLPDGTQLPAQAVVVWCIWAMNRAEDLYGADAAVFRPERWLDDQGKLVHRPAGEFAVFNGGPRACLGRKMAELMAAWVLVKLVGDFDIREEGVGELGSGLDRRERVSRNSLTLPMDGGLPCVVTTRKK